MDLAYIVQTYGYAAVLVGTVLEGETILIIAGFLVNRGYLEMPWVLVCAFLGSFAGDQACFYFGRRYGARYLARRPRMAIRAQRVRGILDRHQLWLVLGFRFVYGLRMITPIVIGGVGFPTGRFLAINAFGAAVWSVAVAAAGYVFGEALQRMIADLKRFELHTIVTMLTIGVLLWLLHVLRSRRLKPPAAQ